MTKKNKRAAKAIKGVAGILRDCHETVQGRHVETFPADDRKKARRAAGEAQAAVDAYTAGYTDALAAATATVETHAKYVGAGIPIGDGVPARAVGRLYVESLVEYLVSSDDEEDGE